MEGGVALTESRSACQPCDVPPCEEPVERDISFWDPAWLGRRRSRPGGSPAPRPVRVRMKAPTLRAASVRLAACMRRKMFSKCLRTVVSDRPSISRLACRRGWDRTDGKGGCWSCVRNSLYAAAEAAECASQFRSPEPTASVWGTVGKSRRPLPENENTIYDDQIASMVARRK